MVKKKTHDEFILDIEELVGNEYTVISAYNGRNNKVTMRHNVCNNEYDVKPSSFYRGYRCGKCARNEKLTLKDIKLKLEDKYNDRYTILGEYINIKTKLKLMDNMTGKVFEKRIDSLLYGDSTKQIGKPRIKRTQSSFEIELSKLTNDEYELIGRYTKLEDKTKFKHLVCGTVYESTPRNLIRGRGCPKCKESKGEKAISTYLSNNSINYISQYRFKNCKNIKELPFDFYIEDKLLIEFDGEQHFKPVKVFGGEDGFDKRKKNDTIKNKYCLDNKIPLLRIPYWEKDNIEYIICNTLIYLEGSKDKLYDRRMALKYLVNSAWNQDTYISKGNRKSA